MDLVTMDSVCLPSEDVVARVIEGEIVIVPIASGIGDAEDELYSLSPTGQAIWEKLDGKMTLGQVAQALAQEYEAAPLEIEGDVLGFASELVRRRILELKS
jgi:hypothetical protein